VDEMELDVATDFMGGRARRVCNANATGSGMFSKHSESLNELVFGE
jgi:hypothetical protein